MVPKSKRVGAVHAHGLDVVVKPKMKIQRLLFMLGYAVNPGFRPENVEGVEADELWAIVAETLCRNAERALARGVLLGYTTEHATSAVVRGRIRIGDQITKRPGRLTPMEITHDEYTVDITENRLLRTAVRRMLKVPRVEADIRRRLQHVDNKLAGSSPLAPRALIPPWRPTRLNAPYQPALRIADLVLRTLSFEVGCNGLSIASFVVNMEQVFEDFVTTALTEAWSTGPGRTHRQFPARLDGVVPMKIDAVHLVDETPRFVVDAKYKLESKSGRYPATDLYQVLAYCTALRVDRAWLVYASGTAGVVPRRISNSPVTITEYPLDLDVPPSDLLAQLDRLARSAWLP
nr:McrC family protein [Kibdelosporangium phytohabitans]